jgi:uncharacterized protein YhfF
VGAGSTAVQSVIVTCVCHLLSACLAALDSVCLVTLVGVCLATFVSVRPVTLMRHTEDGEGSVAWRGLHRGSYQDARAVSVGEGASSLNQNI